MILLRRLDWFLVSFAVAALAVGGAKGQEANRADARLVVAQNTSDTKPASKHTAAKKAKPAATKEAKAEETKKVGKPVELASFGDWGAFLAQGGKEKTCYALAMPKDRAPPALKRDQAYVFISSRPAENVRNEVSIIMGFQMKDGTDAKAEIAGANFDLIAKGSNAWVKNPAQEPQFIDAMKHGAKLVVRAPSLKGNVTTDSYSLAGLSQALERVQKECP
jgi:hypothetical protein